MGVSGARQTYRHVIEYGMRKVRLRFDRLFLQSFMAGVYIGMAGNACISFAGGFSTDPSDPRSISPVMQKFIFAAIFPVAFIAIITTGAELFTGNTMTMLICLFERRVTFLQLLRNWCGSFLGNWVGTLFSSYFLTYLCCHFEKQPYFGYLNAIAEHKTSHGWGGCFLRGVGCNTWVCLAVWFVLACEDWAGKILALWFPIVCFVLSSYEHIIANLYTLQLCAMFGVSTPLSRIIVFNLLPTFLGNLVGGCGLVGAVYFYNFYPGGSEEGTEAESHYEFDDQQRCTYGKDHGLLKTCDEKKKGNYLGGTIGGPAMPHETSGFLFKDGIPALQLPGAGAGGGGGCCPAGAATAAECSDNSSNNLSNDKDGTGAARSGGGTRGELSQQPAYVSVTTKTAEEEPDLEKGRNPPAGGGSASAETWAGENFSSAEGRYSSNDNTAASGTEAFGGAVLNPVAVHAAAVELADTRGTVSDAWRGNAVQFTVPCPPRSSKEAGQGPDLVLDSSLAGLPGVKLTAATGR